MFSILPLYVGLINPKLENKSDKYLMRILLTICKKAITRKLLQPEILDIGDNIGIVHEIYVMETLTMNLCLQSENFIKFWGKWVDYIL